MHNKNFILLIDPYMSIDAIFENMIKTGCNIVALRTFPISELGVLYRKKLEKVKFYSTVNSSGNIEKDIDLLGKSVGSISNFLCGFVSCEKSVIYGEKILKRIFPNFANSTETSNLRIIKTEMNKAVRAQYPDYSIPEVSFNYDNYSANYKNIIDLGFPLVLKRDGLCGTVGLKFCDKEEEVKTYLNNLETDGKYIAQKRIFGTEYNIDTFSFNKNHFINSIFKYNKIDHEGSPLYNYMDLIYNASNKGKEIENVTKNILNSLDVSYGLTNIEVFENGTNYWFIELNNRIPGCNGMFTRIEKLVYNCSQLDFAANYIMKNDISSQLNLSNGPYYRAFFAKNLHKQRYSKFNSKLISQEKNILYYEVLLNDCENPDQQYVFNSPAMVILKTNSLSELQETTAKFEEYDRTAKWFI